MFQYLRWLHEQVQGRPLVLDSFRAHFSSSVQQLAESLHIQLIKVPPNGTGKYQPLDRYICGALKAKLKAITVEPANPYERFKVIGQNLVSSWRAITQECITKAWEIEGLEEFENLLLEEEVELQE